MAISGGDAKKIVDILYNSMSSEFRDMDSTFYGWDKGDCSTVGALLVLIKVELEKRMEEPYYLESYSCQEELYKVLFEDPTRFIS